MNSSAGINMDNQIDRSIIDLGDQLFMTPELGYKEFKTKKIITDFLNKNGFEIENECFETAFSVSLGKGHPHIGLIAELDAIPTLGHPYANVDDNNAAHACGHSTQCAQMIGVMVALKKADFKQGKVTLFFTPAEEYTDIDYRRQLIRDGKINYFGGKINMLQKGLFDDVDCLIHTHAYSAYQYRYSVASHLGGFVFKRLIFKGKAAHAAVCPDEGNNALNAFILFQNAMAMLRETYRDDDHVRVHGMVNEGGQTVNSIPERVVYDMYVRSLSTDKVVELSKTVDNVATHCAAALNCSCTIETDPGYIPLVQSRLINELIVKNCLKYCDEKELLYDEISIAASDLGDLSNFIPTVELGYGGFKGFAHSRDFMIVDKERIYLETADVITNTVLDLLNDPELIKRIKEDHHQRLLKEDYLSYINNK